MLNLKTKYETFALMLHGYSTLFCSGQLRKVQRCRTSMHSRCSALRWSSCWRRCSGLLKLPKLIVKRSSFVVNLIIFPTESRPPLFLIVLLLDLWCSSSFVNCSEVYINSTIISLHSCLFSFLLFSNTSSRSVCVSFASSITLSTCNAGTPEAEPTSWVWQCQHA